MPIKLNVIEKGQPGAVGGGAKKQYANTVRMGEMTLDELTTSIEKISTVSGSDIRAVLYALVNASIDALSNSKIVRLGDLGSLMTNVKSEGRNTLKAITSSAIKGPNVIFKPDRRIKKMQATVKFQKV